MGTPNNGKTHHVTEVDAVSKRFRSMEQVDGSHWLDPMCFTHERPVLDADGVEIRVGDTVWDVESGIEYEVVGIHTDEDTPVRVMRTDGSHLAKAAKPSTLTHQRPVLGEQRQVALRRREEERANQGGSMQELKPCPCCGSSNGLYVLQDEKYGEWSVFCDICKTSLHNENHCDTRDDAISAWNRRAERTCRNLNPPSCRDFECSECGESSEFTPGFMPNYCPNCGARVIEEGV